MTPIFSIKPPAINFFGEYQQPSNFSITPQKLRFTNILVQNLSSPARISLSDIAKLRELNIDPTRLKAADLFLVEPPLTQSNQLAIDQTSKFHSVSTAQSIRQAPEPKSPFRSNFNQDNPKYQQWENRRQKQERPSVLSQLFRILASVVALR